MNILNTVSLKSNNKNKVNFEGGDLSSDAGLLLLNEFFSKIGVSKLFEQMFKTNDTASTRIHKDAENLSQVIFQITSGYFTDNCAKELTKEPVMTAILNKEALASQPTLSRFFNRMDKDTLDQMNCINRVLRKTTYSIEMPQFMLFDIDSTLLETYGSQEGEGFNYHYGEHGYHPLLCYDGLTGDLLKAELRNGSMYCCNGAATFMESLIDEFNEDFPGMPLYLRGDSGFASPELYEVLEKKDCKYAIRLKENPRLHKSIEDKVNAFVTQHDTIDYAVEYGEFLYKADSWSHPRRVVFKIEKPQGQFIHNYTFIVTTMEMTPQKVIMLYCNRGRMENFIREGKNGFDFAAVSSASKTVNANRLMVHVLAYNLFNWFRRIALAVSMRKLRIDTIRLRLIKIAARVVKSARYKYFKLCSSCPYKKEFYETLENINNLQPLL